ncbi:unnamed protein product [Sphagnum tenellum]
MRVARLLQLGHNSQYVVHPELSLLRLHAPGVGVGHVDVDEIREVKAKVGDAGLILERDAVHVLSEAREVVPLRKEIGQLVERLLILARQMGPGLAEAEDGGALQGGQNGELRVQVLQVVQSLGHPDEVRHHLRALLGRLEAEDLLHHPERHVVEASDEGDDVRRHLQLVLLVPRAGHQLLRLDRLEDGKVEQGQLGSEIFGREVQRLEVVRESGPRLGGVRLLLRVVVVVAGGQGGASRGAAVAVLRDDVDVAVGEVEVGPARARDDGGAADDARGRGHDHSGMSACRDFGTVVAIPTQHWRHKIFRKATVGAARGDSSLAIHR